MLQLDGEYLEALVARGNLLMLGRQWTAAKEDFARALEIEPRCGPAWLRAGDCDSALRNHCKADEEYHRAALVDPRLCVEGIFCMTR